MKRAQNTFLEFFAGGGMARLGLGRSWRCLLANDLDPVKCAAYAANFGKSDLVEGDIAALSLDDMPKERADLAWGSFPCQDLSLAGARGGMSAARSGAFFPFWSLMEGLVSQGCGPRIIAIENVAGLLTSNGGRDFACVAECLAGAGYAVTAAVIDARYFTPQSRPRLFILGFAPDLAPPAADRPPKEDMAPPALLAAQEALPVSAKARWFWLASAPRAGRNMRLSEIIDWDAPEWHAPEQTQKLIAMMAPHQRARIDKLIEHGARRAGAAFRRTRQENGETVQRVEARFDGLAGCLRTPAGGSSRQIVFAIENGEVRSRLLNPREAARLMGLPDDYRLPQSANAALKLAGDGVCVSVVAWLAETVFEPVLGAAKTRSAA
ncbi:DNA cytosine methyltransferase [Hyphococcus luteus]|uniref:DNA (cytosine-5-)-methyltransferase n=1 Tax=Hyphococcus luteus TaxID=2058213 RepID=A0A2S7K9N7_9PROT|nr:DNA cytosine methyltransferase [Marinicaulis flavus]PQA89159.1 DNA (cytosine-5-)-methyltransferase [Marinicaulis flavus]